MPSPRLQPYCVVCRRKVAIEAGTERLHKYPASRKNKHVPLALGGKCSQCETKVLRFLKDTQFDSLKDKGLKVSVHKRK